MGRWDQMAAMQRTKGQSGEREVAGFWRKDRDQWRAVWPVAVHLAIQERDYWTGYEWTAEGSPEAWAAVAREINIMRGLWWADGTRWPPRWPVTRWCSRP